MKEYHILVIFAFISCILMIKFFCLQLGLAIRAATSGHIPPTPFILVTMGSTGVLLIGWRALICNFLPKMHSQRSDVYRRGSPFELFEVVNLIFQTFHLF